MTDYISTIKQAKVFQDLAEQENRNDIFNRHILNFLKCICSSKEKLICEFNDFKKVNYYVDKIREL